MKTVIKRNGQIVPFQTEEIISAIKYLIEDMTLDDPFVVMFRIIKNFETKMPDQISTTEIDHLLLKSIETLISDDPMYDHIATKQLVKIINKSVNQQCTSFSEYIHTAISQNLLDKGLSDLDLGTLELSLDDTRDNLLNYFGLSNIKDRYLIKDRHKNILEKPQWMRMRIAMGLALLEKDPTSFILQVYDKLSSLKYLHSTPTLFYSGTNNAQMISCFIGVVDDSLDDIMQKSWDVASTVKYAGGQGLSMTKLRASGSYINSIQSSSCGPIPFIKIYDTVVSSVAIGGKRASNMVVYMEPRHYNFLDYLDLKETNGNEFMRARKLNTASWIPDNFMERVESDSDRYLFDPHECPELHETRGSEFTTQYDRYIALAQAGQIKLFHKMSAKELYREILIRLAKNGNYRLNFKDRFNEKSQAPSYGPIHSSNMCTEIGIPNRVDSTATCTLASLNLSRFILHTAAHLTASSSWEERLQCIDLVDLQATVQIAIRALDNVVDLNYYIFESAKKNSFDLRPLGLGIMGLGEILIQLGIPYDSPECLKLSTYLSDFIYQAALATSIALGEERGTFLDYNPAYTYQPRRNILLMAIAPTATISNIAGTSSGIETYFSNIYSRETISGKFTVTVGALVQKLKAANLRNESIKEQIIANQGSIQSLVELDGIIDKRLFKTVYEIDPFAQIDVAAARQKSVDQAISRNLYIPEEKREKLAEIYMYAWKSQLKSTYYCFIEKKIQGEKYTSQVNKRGSRLGFGTSSESAMNSVSSSDSPSSPRGFGSVQLSDDPRLGGLTRLQIEEKLIAEKGQEYVDKLKKGELYDGCPTDPFEKVMCEGCQ